MIAVHFSSVEECIEELTSSRFCERFVPFILSLVSHLLSSLFWMVVWFFRDKKSYFKFQFVIESLTTAKMFTASAENLIV